MPYKNKQDRKPDASPYCANGHTYTPETVRYDSLRKRICLTCELERKTRTHCPSGHEFTPENTRISKTGTKQCRECDKAWSKEYRQIRKGAKVKTIITVEERFWAKVLKHGRAIKPFNMTLMPPEAIDALTPEEKGCWEWQLGLDKDGYGKFNITHNTTCRVHRYAYELIKGLIPDGMALDHTCRVRHCVNPSHLQPCTNSDNIMRGCGAAAINARKTHCNRGHSLTGDNSYRNPGDLPHYRRCKICRLNTQHRSWRAGPNYGKYVNMSLEEESAIHLRLTGLEFTPQPADNDDDDQ